MKETISEDITGKNSCYTYFAMHGKFNPDIITESLGLIPTRQWSIGDLRKCGSAHPLAFWEYGKCDEYDVNVENQMIKTLADLVPKTKELQSIKQKYDVRFFLAIVPSIYVNEITPCFSPSREVIEFCYNTNTEIDIDLYVYNSDESKDWNNVKQVDNILETFQ